jgi:hypothetical protein
MAPLPALPKPMEKTPISELHGAWPKWCVPG